MKYLASPEFLEKVQLLGERDREGLGLALREIQSATSVSDLVGRASASVLDEDIYVLSQKRMKVFFTTTEISQDERILLLDVAVEADSPDHRRPLSVSRDPNRDIRLNPKTNSMINPRVNSMINPQVNSMINPRVNSMINPQVNSMINPRVNSMINPRVNSMINPRVNSSFGGPFVYDLNMNRNGFLVRANDKVDLMFDNNLEHIGTVVRSSENIRHIFDSSNEWIGFLVQGQNNVEIRFDARNEWSGLVI